MFWVLPLVSILERGRPVEASIEIKPTQSLKRALLLGFGTSLCTTGTQRTVDYEKICLELLCYDFYVFII
jgi:hypothetical protein